MLKTTHKMRDGTMIKIQDMSDRHLENTINLIKRTAEEGVVVLRGGGGPSHEEFWCDEDVVSGEEAEKMLCLDAYEMETRRRKPC